MTMKHKTPKPSRHFLGLFHVWDRWSDPIARSFTIQETRCKACGEYRYRTVD